MVLVLDVLAEIRGLHMLSESQVDCADIDITIIHGPSDAMNKPFPSIQNNVDMFATSRNKSVVSKVTTSSSTPAYLPEITALTDAIKALLLQNKTPSQLR
ncbi:hypothetical protein Tco_0465939 [Tanacetum coccineum]